MCAALIKFGDSPPGIGGDYERDVAQTLYSHLSNKYLIVTNASLPTRTSFFYEYDIILLSPFCCDVIEIKYLYEHVDVYMDHLESVNGFLVPSVFSILENKAKVFRSKIRNGVIKWEEAPFPTSRVIVGPNDTTIKYKYKKHEENKKLLKLHEAISFYKDKENESSEDKVATERFKMFRSRLKNYSENLQTNQKKKHRLGRFYIKRPISKKSDYSEYWAVDEPPCNVDVHLKEYPFDQFEKDEDVEKYLKKVTRGMQVLRGLRHQYISCVIGHFQTGCSLVQINDWFDGKLLSECWDGIRGLGLSEKVSLMIKISQGIGFCHEKGVFHRNICAENILINNDLDDIRITGFDYAKDIDHTKTMTSTAMNKRNRQIIPCEEFMTVGSKVENLRLYDIYQAALLFYRICEGGLWPFDDPLEYCTGEGILKAQTLRSTEFGAKELNILIKRMVSIEPNNRPNLMKKVEDQLDEILELVNQ
jgi:hypothetical protein